MGSVSCPLLFFVFVCSTFVYSSTPTSAPSHAAGNLPSISRITREMANSEPAPSNELMYLSSLGLNVHEYPNDDFSHILGANLPEHERNTYNPSKLQQICVQRLEDVARSKGISDGSEGGDFSNDIVSIDEYKRLIVEFDLEHGSPLDLRERINADATVIFPDFFLPSSSYITCLHMKL